MSVVVTSGLIIVHSAPKAVCPHIEWALSNVLGNRVRLEWTEQPAGFNLMRAEYIWQSSAGSGAKIASALRGWDGIRYEVTEQASQGTDASRWVHTPSLGIFHTTIDAFGNSMVSEDRIKLAMEYSHDAARMAKELRLALGQAWDEELEPFRYASQGAPVRWLHQVG